jgi:hypothetical protein
MSGTLLPHPVDESGAQRIKIIDMPHQQIEGSFNVTGEMMISQFPDAPLNVQGGLDILHFPDDPLEISGTLHTHMIPPSEPIEVAVQEPSYFRLISQGDWECASYTVGEDDTIAVTDVAALYGDIWVKFGDTRFRFHSGNHLSLNSPFLIYSGELIEVCRTGLITGYYINS